jgi:glycosyltransferase involved in cell wall biosynthesis
MTAASRACFLSLIIPMHNESANLDALFARVTPVLEGLGGPWEILCIDDGSRDDTRTLLREHHRRDSRVKYLFLSRNFGKEAAMTAGLDHASGQVVIPIDADLQDPPELIPELVRRWRGGYKVVLASRRRRAGESWLKRSTAALFYRIMGRLSRVPIPPNTGDFRLLDRQVVDVIRRLPERSRFMKGIFVWPGFSTTTVYFDREQRHRGTSTWSYWRLWQFALDGIFSFTTLPLRIWTYLGLAVSLGAFGYGLFLTLRTLLEGVAVPGYASMMVMMLFLGGIQLISLGVIGEYVGRIYRETKGRPLYVIEERDGDAHQPPS